MSTPAAGALGVGEDDGARLVAHHIRRHGDNLMFGVGSILTADVCVASDAHFNLTLIRWWRIKNAAGSMPPLEQSGSRSAKTENDTLTPGRRLAPSAGCLRHSRGEWRRQPRRVVFSRQQTLSLLIKKTRRRQ
ncbi:MAG: hypothetical protein MPK62_11880 [Alphaproteobacteria bacterium]|nr:hypothetical protein [Alphaproteobacteria bacterium]